MRAIAAEHEMGIDRRGHQCRSFNDGLEALHQAEVASEHHDETIAPSVIGADVPRG
jgi:hypothetical protein